MTVIEIVHPVTAIVGVSQAPGSVVGVAPVVGPAGPQGPAGDSIAFEYVQATPLATWTITHNFGRRPNVAVFIAGSEVEATIDADATTVVITFYQPFAGVAVLT